MESLKLNQFYRVISTWPKSEADLSIVSEKFRQLLDIPLILLWVPQLGIRGSGINSLDHISPESFFELVQFEIHRIQSTGLTESFQLKQIQLSSDTNLSSNGSQMNYLAALPLIAGNSQARQDVNRQDFGWIIAGSNKPLSVKTEILFMAAARHLIYLGTVDHKESALKLRDQFLSLASHELKTPLTAIYGILQLQDRMLRSQKTDKITPEQEKQMSFFKIVLRQVERLNELIDGLLDVSRIQVGRFVVDPSEIDVANVLRDTIVSRLNVISEEAGISLHVEAPEHLPAWVDPIRFEEVITNLVMNAIRFSPEGGMVWIRLKEDQQGFILSIRDQGPSVPEQDRNRIFQPFERAQRTSRLGGLGLGLFISRQIAQLHGGNVSLSESIPGKGNVFEARFPMKKKAEASQQLSA